MQDIRDYIMEKESDKLKGAKIAAATGALKVGGLVSYGANQEIKDVKRIRKLLKKSDPALAKTIRTSGYKHAHLRKYGGAGTALAGAGYLAKVAHDKYKSNK